MHSSLKFQSAMVEAEVDQISEVEEEIFIEEEEAAHQAQVEEVAANIHVKIHLKITFKSKGMTNLKSNVTIARNLGII